MIAVGTILLSPRPRVEGNTGFLSKRLVSANAPLSLNFSGRMNQSSVESAWRVSPDLSGSFKWEGNQVQYWPAAPLPVGATYTVHVSEEAKSLWGKPLERAYDVVFVVTDIPAVSYIYPQEEVVPVEVPLTVMFNRPIIELTDLKELSERAPAIEISPAVAGEWRWIDTQTVQYTPRNGWNYATNYEVKVPQGLRAADGGQVETAVSVKFSTPRLALVAQEPAPAAESVSPLADWVLTFNTPVKLDELKNNLKIEPSLAVDVVPDSTDPKIIRIKHPSLDKEKKYTLTLPGGLPPASGERGLEKETRWSFTVAGDPKVVTTSPEKEVKTTDLSAIYLEFNNPLKIASVKDLVTVTPAIKNLAVVADPWDTSLEEGKQLYLTGDWQYGTSYTVTVKAGGQDAYGQTLAQPIEWKFATDDAPPYLSIGKKTTYNMVSGYYPVAFPLQSTNLEQANLKLCELAATDYVKRAMTYSWEVNDLPCVTTKEWSLDLSKVRNKSMVTPVDLGAISGFYNLKVTSGDYTDNVWFYTAKTAIFSKKANDTLLVWTVDLKTGQPVKSNLRLVDNEGRELLTGSTNEQGVYQVKTNADNIAILADNSAGTSFLHQYWSAGLSAWEFGFQGGYGQPVYAALLTDRPIYGQGQTVYFKGVVREDKGALVPSAVKKARVVIHDARYEEVYNQELPITDTGTFFGELTIADQANVGDYSLEATVGENTFYKNFSVEDYRPPKYKVTLDLNKEDYVTGENIEAQIGGEYYYGGPLARAKVRWTLVAMPYFYYADGYIFGDGEKYSAEPSNETQMIANGEGQLDEAGRFKLSQPAVLKDNAQTQLYTLEATLEDSEAQSVSQRQTVIIHPGPYYLGIKSDGYWYSVGDNIPIKVKTLDLQKNAAALSGLTVTVDTRTWVLAKKENMGDFINQYEPKDEQVTSLSLDTGRDGQGETAFTPAEPGYYVFRVHSSSSQPETVASLGVYVGGSGEMSWYFEDNNRFEIVPDKAEYQVGDVAKLLVRSPYKNVTALVTHERTGVKSYELMNITDFSTTLSVPVTEDFVPNEYLSVTIFKGSDYRGGAEAVPNPDFKMGYANLKVNREQHRLQVTVKPNKDRYLPGEEVILDVTTTTAQGQPVAADVAVAVADESVLALKGNPQEDLMDYFYAERPLAVDNATNMSVYIKNVDIKAMRGSKGGDGGTLEKRLRGEFKDTAYWQARVMTDAQGRAQLKFKLPDNLTTWQITAYAVTATDFGQARNSILANKDLMVSPIVPRFVRVGDTLWMGARVVNNTTSDVYVTTELTADLAKVSDGTAHLSVPRGEAKEAWWKLVIGEGQSLKLVFKATNGDQRDEVELHLPLLETAAWEQVATANETTSLATEYLTRPANSSDGSLTVQVASALVGKSGLMQGLGYLLHYPYGCAEQLMSAILPVVLLKDIGGDLEPWRATLAIDTKETNLDEYFKKILSVGLQKIYDLQRVDNGWGYFAGAERSYPHLTAYILYGLYRVQNYTSIDQTLVEHGRTYLKDYFNAHPLKAEGQNLASLAAERAYGLYVLSLWGEPTTAWLKNLEPYAAQMPYYAQAYLAMAFQKTGDAITAQKILRTVIGLGLADEQARTLHFEEKQADKWAMNTDLRTTAVVGQALLAILPDDPRLPKIVRWMTKNVDWQSQSTQELVTTLTFLNAYLKKQGTATMNVDVDLNGADKKDYALSTANPEASTTWPWSALAEQNTVSVSKANGSDPLYYTLALRYRVPIDELAPQSAGFSLRSDYYTLDDVAAEHPLTSLRLGENYKTRVTVVVPAERHFVMVESHLPAGLEAVNFSLETSEQNLSEQINQPDEKSSEPWWWSNLYYFYHQEIRNDRVVLYADNLPAGVYTYEYVVRATSRGQFADPADSVYEMYFPEVFGHTMGRTITVEQ